MNRLTGFLGLALAGAALTMLGDTAFAQRGGQGGGSARGGWGAGGYGAGGYGAGMYASPRGYGYGSGYYGGYQPRYSGYYPGYSPYSSGYGYSQGYAPSYGYSQGYAPSYGYQAPMAQDNATARVEVKLPDDNAEVWFDGQKTRQMGSTRSFTTPPLDGAYQYQVSAAWHQDGRLVTQERTVNVKPGANVTVDFTQSVQRTAAQEARPLDRIDDRIPQKRIPDPDRREP